MTFASTRRLSAAARAGGYAIPAVNIVDQLSLQATVAAAQAANSPIILQTSVKTLKVVGAAQLAAAARIAANAVDVPVALHLDHCPDRAVITEAIGQGWSSVLFDASDRDLDQAWAETREVVQEAHAAGVDVESEIENIVGVEDGVGSDEATHAYSVDTLLEVAADTATDLLAPQLGTAHGLYKANPTLLFDRAAEFAGRTDIPIVLHGGTGLSAEDFTRFIDAGISKINISTALKLAYLHSAHRHLVAAEASGKWEPVKLFAEQVEAVTATVTEHIDLFGSRDKAADGAGA